MIRIETRIERWEMIEAFATSRDSITHIPVITVTLTDRLGQTGWGEAAGVDYDGETPESMVAQIESTFATLEDTFTPDELLKKLPRGGARNAVDCALWDLRAKQTGVPAWKSAGLAPLQPVTTVLTLGLADEADTRRKAREAKHYPMLKLKLDATRHVDVVRMVREEHPTARLIVDANQAWSRTLLEQLIPDLLALRVELIEQPLPRGSDAELDGIRSPIPLGADESCTDRNSIKALLGRYQYANIKLDKTGGLTEALAVAKAATQHSLRLMVGNMCGTSLAMAPAFLIAQRCDYVDLDGPLLQKLDRRTPIHFEHGLMQPPSGALWG
jgi:L-Ala-D/L-Glu epimerase